MLRDASTSNGSRALERPSTPAVLSYGSTLGGTALDHAFRPTSETRGPRCQKPDNGGHESCGHDVARVAGQTLIPAHSLVTLGITGVQRPSRPLLASPLAQPLPRGLLLIPTLVSGDATQRCVRLANLSAEDYILARRTPVAVLHVVDGIESDEGVQITTTCNEMTVSMEPSIEETLPSMSAPSDAVPCPFLLLFPALTTSGPGCMPCLISMPMVLPRMSSILGILRQCNTASPPAMMPKSRSPTGAYR